MKILWLASWYPNWYEPTNGDFIQRQAIAVSKIVPINLIHVVQLGKEKSTTAQFIHSQKHNLNEFLYSFSFKKWGWKWLDKIRYNLTYLMFYRKVLKKYMLEYGKPTLIHIQVPMKAGMMAIYLLHSLKIPFIVTEHSSMYNPLAADNFYKRSVFFKRNTKNIFQKAVVVTNVSAAIGKNVAKLFNLKSTVVIHNVVDTTHFYYVAKNENTKFKWLHVSSLYRLKNVDKIIKAFKLLNKIRQDWEFTIVGNAPQYLVEMVNQLGLSTKIKFTGEVSYTQVAKHMQASSALVLFSKHENFPCVIIEALCCGLPVVSSNVGGVLEAINNTNGLLVENENIEDLKNTFIKMMNNYKQYNQPQIAKKAAQIYSEKSIGEKFVTLYQQAINGN